MENTDSTPMTYTLAEVAAWLNTYGKLLKPLTAVQLRHFVQSRGIEYERRPGPIRLTVAAVERLRNVILLDQVNRAAIVRR